MMENDLTYSVIRIINFLMSPKILIAGQEGMVGKAVYKLLKKKKFKIIECIRNELDFTSQQSVEKWFKKNKPDIV